jgi:hypothetical protein
MAMQNDSNSRRDFIKKAAYVAPVILTLNAAPSYAKKGSDKKSNGYGQTKKD